MTPDQLRYLIKADHPDGTKVLVKALQDHGGDVQATARALGIGRMTLYRIARPILDEHGAGKYGSGLASARVRAEKAALQASTKKSTGQRKKVSL